ncbi:MAG TPA: hypothetical protein VHK28_05525, partial [Candidatus Limnocylindria bacterium]|nr:hypothetical protein [Candidatus Limnocylindria bacterium]
MHPGRAPADKPAPVTIGGSPRTEPRLLAARLALATGGWMKLQEYRSKEVLARHGVPLLDG